MFEHIALATLLFVVYFTGFCFLFTSPEAEAVVSQNREVEVRESELTLAALEDAFSVEPEEIDEEEVTQEVVTQQEVVHYPAFDTLINSFGKTKVTLRDARKIAGKLGIKQKVSNKDQPRDWLVGQIRKRYEQDQEAVIPILEQVYQSTTAVVSEQQEENTAKTTAA